MLRNNALTSQYRVIGPVPSSLPGRLMQVEPLTGGESRLMLVLDLPDSGLKSDQVDYLESLASFTESKDNFLTPLQISLEGKQIIAITHLPDGPNLNEQSRLTVDQGERLLSRLLVKLSLAQKQELNPSCFQPESLYVTSQEIRCNALAAVARVMESEPEKDSSQIARSVIQAITGLRVSTNSFDSFWQAEISFENPHLRQLLDDLISCRITWASAALTHLRSAKIEAEKDLQIHTDSNKTTKDIVNLAATQNNQVLSEQQAYGFPELSPERSRDTSFASTPSHSAIASASKTTSNGAGCAWAFLLFIVGAFLLAVVSNNSRTTSSNRSETNTEQTSSTTLSYRSTCGSNNSSSDTWWPVLGDSQHLSQVRENYCGDAYINPNGYLQVASFDSESKAQEFVRKLNSASGLDFRVGSPKQIGTTPEIPESAPEIPESAQPPEQTSSEPTCWFQLSEGDSLTGLACNVSSRVNANGTTVYDLVEPDGTKRSVILWDNNTTEVFLKGTRHEGSWRTDEDGDIRVSLDQGEFAFKLP